MKKWILWLLGAALAVSLFSAGIRSVEDRQKREAKLALEEALRQTAVTCYACEGFYPPDVAYMQAHYGLRYEKSDYIIHYVWLGSNLMPDITVIERK